MAIPYYAILTRAEASAHSIVHTCDGLPAARKWVKTEGKKMMQIGDRIDLCGVRDSMTATAGEIVLVSAAPIEDDDKADATPSPSAT